MIQRIQSVYLVLAMLAIMIVPFVFPLWYTEPRDPYYFMQSQVYSAMFGLGAALSLLSLMSYKKRQQQFVYNRVNILLNLILLGLFLYRTIIVSGDAAQVSVKGIAMFVPIVAIVFLVLANKAIKKDEDLVKSVDRLR